RDRRRAGSPHRRLVRKRGGLARGRDARAPRAARRDRAVALRRRSGRAVTIAENLRSVRERIARAAEKAKRDPGEVALVAVAKTFPTDAIREAYAAGQRLFGENYVQELVTKADELEALRDLKWHFIGHLQRNKVKPVLATHAVIETVDS